jgi:hypothetical protein
MKELLDWSRSTRNSIMLGTSGTGSQSQFVAVQIEKAEKVSFTQVPFKGQADILLAVAGSQIQLAMMNLPSAIKQYKDKRIKMLATMTDKRTSATPEIPTLAEAGIPSIREAAWYGFLAPASTPGAAARQALERPGRGAERARREGQAHRPGPRRRRQRPAALRRVDARRDRQLHADRPRREHQGGLTMSEVVVLDLAELRHADVAVRRELGRRMVDVCRTVGFFYIVNHGISGARMRRMFELTRAFFDLPMEEKMALSMAKSKHWRGYLPMLDLGNDPVAQGQRAGELPRLAGACARRSRRPWPKSPCTASRRGPRRCPACARRCWPTPPR